MKTIYIANDGQQFEDEYECELHEFKLKHPHLQTIEVYNKECGKETDIFDEDEYYNCNCKIIIHSEEELSDLQALVDHLDFDLYGDIYGVGEWIFDYEKGYFVKYVNPSFNRELSNKYVSELNEYNSEVDHDYADDALVELLLDLGYKEVVEAYRKVPK